MLIYVLRDLSSSDPPSRLSPQFHLVSSTQTTNISTTTDTDTTTRRNFLDELEDAAIISLLKKDDSQATLIKGVVTFIYTLNILLPALLKLYPLPITHLYSLEKLASIIMEHRGRITSSSSMDLPLTLTTFSKLWTRMLTGGGIVTNGEFKAFFTQGAVPLLKGLITNTSSSTRFHEFDHAGMGRHEVVRIVSMYASVAWCLNGRLEEESLIEFALKLLVPCGWLTRVWLVEERQTRQILFFSSPIKPSQECFD